MALGNLDEEAFQLLYGRWDPLAPGQVADLLSSASVRWYIVGGLAARVGAPPRHHEDTDVAVRADDLGRLRKAMADWHLWEASSGALRPLLPGVALSEGCQQLWARRNAREPWQLDLPLDRSGDEWVFKRDARVRVPWERALQTVDGIPYLRPEIALLHKAHHDRPKDREDLAAAQLDTDARGWLARTLEMLGHRSWAQLVRAGQRRDLRSLPDNPIQRPTCERQADRLRTPTFLAAGRRLLPRSRRGRTITARPMC